MYAASSPREYLFVTWEGGGNIPPALTVVRKLLARGHRVRVMSDSCNQADIETVGAEFIPYRLAPNRMDKTAASDLIREWEAPSPQEAFACVVDRLMCGPALNYARDVLAELDRRKPDILVSSEFLFGVMVAAEASGQTLTLLATNLSLFPIPGIPPLGPGFPPARDEATRRLHAEVAQGSKTMLNAGLSALNAARAALGLGSLGDVLDQLKVADRFLLATSSAFDFEAESLPKNLRYVGPQLDDPAWAAPWEAPWSAKDRRPLVLVAFSTTFQDQTACIQRVIDAIAALPVRGLVTLGPTLSEAIFSVPDNVVVRRSVPHSQAMPDAAAVVTHAGHGTTMRALAHGVPLLCLPMGRDQNDNTARVVTRGAGLQLDPFSADSEQIRQALERLLNDPSFRNAAQKLGGAVAREAGTSSVVEELEALASETASKESLAAV